MPRTTSYAAQGDPWQGAVWTPANTRGRDGGRGAPRSPGSAGSAGTVPSVEGAGSHTAQVQESLGAASAKVAGEKSV